MTGIFDEIKDFLESEDSIFFTFKESMAEPEFSEDVPTACVVFRKDGDDALQFKVNESFWKGLNYTEKCFLFGHETLHIMLKHGTRGAAFFDTLDEKDRNHHKLNVAMDVCINEILMSQFFEGVGPKDIPTLYEYGCFIKTVFTDRDIAVEEGKNFEYYYNAIPDDDTNSTFDAHTFLDMTDEELEKLDSLIEELGSSVEDEESFQDESGGYSLEDTNSFDNVVKKKEKTQESLEKYIDFAMRTSIKKENSKRKTDWYSANRRTVGLNRKDITVPNYKLKTSYSKHKIVLYCDVSGSCAAVSAKFIDMIDKINRDKYDLVINVFASRVGKAKNSEGSISYSNVGYGTNINNVLNHYGREHAADKSVDGVFVLTDGLYSNISHMTNDEYKKWVFFMTTKSSNAPKNSKIIELKGL